VRSARVYRMLLQAGVLALLVFGAPGHARAQAAVTAMQPLDFGQILPGLAETVGIQDTWRRAEVRVEGGGNFDVRIILPQALVSPEGARIPLVFRNGDAAYAIKANRQVTFDPNVTQRIRIPPGQGEAMLYLGGTATTTPGQRAGQYSATLVVVVSNTAL